MEFGEWLRQYRTAAGLSQEELAQRAGLSAHGISDLERGARKNPYPATVRLLADALGVTDAERAQLRRAAQRASSGRTAAGIPDAPSARLHEPRTSFVGRGREIAGL